MTKNCILISIILLFSCQVERTRDLLKNTKGEDIVFVDNNFKILGFGQLNEQLNATKQNTKEDQLKFFLMCKNVNSISVDYCNITFYKIIDGKRVKINTVICMDQQLLQYDSCVTSGQFSDYKVNSTQRLFPLFIIKSENENLQTINEFIIKISSKGKVNQESYLINKEEKLLRKVVKDIQYRTH